MTYHQIAHRAPAILEKQTIALFECCADNLQVVGSQ